MSNLAPTAVIAMQHTVLNAWKGFMEAIVHRNALDNASLTVICKLVSAEHVQMATMEPTVHSLVQTNVSRSFVTELLGLVQAALLDTALLALDVQKNVLEIAQIVTLKHASA